MSEQPAHVDRAEATDEQRTAARDSVRAKLAAARERHDAGYWEQLRTRFGVTAEA